MEMCIVRRLLMGGKRQGLNYERERSEWPERGGENSIEPGDEKVHGSSQSKSCCDSYLF